MAALQALVDAQKGSELTPALVKTELDKLTGKLAVFSYDGSWMLTMAARHQGLLSPWKIALANLRVEKYVAIEVDKDGKVTQTAPETVLRLAEVRRPGGELLWVDRAEVAKECVFAPFTPQIIPGIGFGLVEMNDKICKMQVQNFPVIAFYRDKPFTRAQSWDLAVNHACHLANKRNLCAIPMDDERWTKIYTIVNNTAYAMKLVKTNISVSDVFAYLVSRGHASLAWVSYGHSRRTYFKDESEALELFKVIQGCTRGHEEAINLLLLMLSNPALKPWSKALIDHADDTASFLRHPEILKERSLPFGYIGLFTDPTKVQRAFQTMVIVSQASWETWENKGQLAGLNVHRFGTVWPGNTMFGLVKERVGCQRLFIEKSDAAKTMLEKMGYKEVKEVNGIVYFQHEKTKLAQEQLCPGRWK